MAISQEVKALYQSLKNTNSALLNDGAKAVRKEVIKQFDPLYCANASLEDVMSFLESERSAWQKQAEQDKELDATLSTMDEDYAKSFLIHDLGPERVQQGHGTWGKSASRNEYGTSYASGEQYGAGGPGKHHDQSYREMMDARQHSSAERIEYINSLLEQVQAEVK